MKGGRPTAYLLHDTMIAFGNADPGTVKENRLVFAWGGSREEREHRTTRKQEATSVGDKNIRYLIVVKVS